MKVTLGYLFRLRCTNASSPGSDQIVHLYMSEIPGAGKLLLHAILSVIPKSNGLVKKYYIHDWLGETSSFHLRGLHLSILQTKQARSKTMDELQKRVVAKLAQGVSPSTIAAEMSIHRTTVYSIKKLYDETGGYSRHARGGRPCTTLTETLIAAVKEQVESKPSMSCRKLAWDFSVPETSMRE